MILVALAALAAGCGGGGGGSGDDADGTFVIGVDNAQTGSLAPFDQPVLKGLRLCADEVNAQGGLDGKHKIELIVRDMRSDPAQAATIAQDFVQEGVNLMILPSDQDPSISAGQIAQSAQIPAISPGASTPTLPLAVGKFMFGNMPADNAQATVSATYARDHDYETAYLLIGPDTAYTQKLPEYFGEVFEAKGGQVIGKNTYRAGSPDFGAQVASIKDVEERLDVIMTSAYEPDFPAFVKQLRAAGVDTPIIGSDGIDSATVTKLGSVVDGVVFTAGGFPTPGSELEAFNESYLKKYGEEADTAFAGFGCDVIRSIDAAVTKAGSTDPTAVRDALAELEDVKGATGPITYAGTDRMPLREVSLLELGGGQRKLIDQVAPPLDEIPEP